ncbi:hypothetical protein IX317_000810 [Fusobacterium sp. DD29]|uniref:hypothetical protein n=1 Tax=unclassified Fusobacterium TaxID=2648384 RepID=UPI001B8CB12D|nr:MULTISPECIES: hypothetical protein [unclassified Fusobacterium]MBR8700780.1 hypothetical protein [Fusobacterium sp. DD45]MBR8710559.1 hypothetical protein [Fusobacterium sp. DD28]MBR8749148.1 hypothetical protein [Fusobacterium sp. DD29]MBR8751091.1 hypothetical protein [Fusobacterium sp. DD26]MBR8761414.1 hypothetical protein [Fusobacterium sp. DD25]
MKEQGKLAFGIIGAFAIAFVISGCFYLQGLYAVNRERRANQEALERYLGKSEKKDVPKNRFSTTVEPNIEAEKYVPLDVEKEFKSLGLEAYIPKPEDKVVKSEDVKDDKGNVVGKKEYKESGVVVITSLENGKLVSTTTGLEKDGKLDGEVTVVYGNGEKDVYTYKKGIRQGKCTLYFSNGDREESNYDKDKLVGKATYYFSNGDKEEYNYKDGVIDGDAKYIYADGKTESYKYENGVRK